MVLCFGLQSRLIHRPLASAWMGVIPQGRSGLLGEELPSLEVFLLRAGLGAVGSGLRPSAPSTAWPQGGAMSQIKDWNYDKAKLQGRGQYYRNHLNDLPSNQAFTILTFSIHKTTLQNLKAI